MTQCQIPNVHSLQSLESAFIHDAAAATATSFKSKIFKHIFHKVLSRRKETNKQTNKDEILYSLAVSLVNRVLLSHTQVVGVGSICLTLSVGAYLVFWLVLPQ